MKKTHKRFGRLFGTPNLYMSHEKSQMFLSVILPKAVAQRRCFQIS